MTRSQRAAGRALVVVLVAVWLGAGCARPRIVGKYYLGTLVVTRPDGFELHRCPMGYDADAHEVDPARCVRLSKMKGGGAGLRSEDIDPEVRRANLRAQHCFDALLQVAPRACGAVQLDWVVNHRGHIQHLSVSESTGDERLVECSVRALFEARFPPPSNGVPTVVRRRWVFLRSGRPAEAASVDQCTRR